VPAPGRGLQCFLRRFSIGFPEALARVPRLQRSGSRRRARFCEIFDRIQSLRRNDVWPFDPSGPLDRPGRDLTEPWSMGLRFWALIRRSWFYLFQFSHQWQPSSGNASSFQNPFDKTPEQTQTYYV
jgi:hypothetical protein